MPPNFDVLLLVGLVGIVAVASVRIAKIAARRGASPSELAQLRELVDAHNAALEDARAHLADQSEQITELQERVDFTERLLAQARERSALGEGPGRP